MPKPSRGPKTAAIVFGVLVVLAALLVFAVIPWVVASKIEAAAARRSLTIQYSSAAYRFTHAEVREVTLAPVGSKRVTLRAPTVEARIFGLSPSWIILPKVDATVSGSIDDVLAALEPVRKADAALPAAERLPVDVNGGTLVWTSPFGSGSKFDFRDLKATIRPADSLVTANLSKGKLTLAGLSLDGVSVEVRRDTRAGERVDLRASLASDDAAHATLEAHKKGASLVVDGDVSHFDLSQASADIPGLDFDKAVADVVFHFERDDEGAIRSNGKLSITKLRLPPIKVGPVSFAVGGAVKASWKGTPKKGAPGTMLLDDGKVDVVLGGRARGVKISGELAFGEHGEGPYVVKLDWEAGPFPCAELAADAGGAIVKGLAQNVVTGTVRVRGTLRGDLADVSALKKSFEILEACKVDVGKGIGGLLEGLPF